MRESETLELKRSTSELSEAIISIAAILNKHGKGELYFGIRNDGSAIGQQTSESTLRTVSQAIAAGIEPRIYPHVAVQDIAGKNCISVSFEGGEQPYFAFGRAYMRVADSDRQLTVHELKRLLHEGISRTWEKEPSAKMAKDANVKVLRDFMRRARAAGRIGFGYTNARAVLDKLGLSERRKLRRAGEILFCDENSLEVQAAVFAGTEKVTFLDIRSMKGSLFDVLESARGYLVDRMNWRANLTGEGREEIPEIPMRALEEALVNSLAHRDYAAHKNNEIAVFKDRIEIFNPGAFPPGRTPEDYIHGRERSILRNELIAHTLYLRKDVERWGSGLKRIHDACRESGVKVEFQREADGFCVVFWRPKGTTQETTQKTTQKILDAISSNPTITRQELAQALGIGPDGVKFHLINLKKKGILRRIGPDKGGHWEVVPSGALSAGAAAPSALAPSARPRKVPRNHTK